MRDFFYVFVPQGGIFLVYLRKLINNQWYDRHKTI